MSDSDHKQATKSPRPWEARGFTEASLDTCPGHREILWDHPGDCPKCGMGLEVLIPKGDDVECGQWAGRLWWSVALGLPVVFLAMAPMLGLSVIAGTWLGWAEFCSRSLVRKRGRSAHVCRILRCFQRSAACGSR